MHRVDVDLILLQDVPAAADTRGSSRSPPPPVVEPPPPPRESSLPPRESSPLPREPSPLPVCPSGRPLRRTRLPARYRDDLPPQPPPIAPRVSPPPPSPIIDEVVAEAIVQPAIPSYETYPDEYGTYRSYPGGQPSFTPDDRHTLHTVSDSSNFTKDPESEEKRPWWSTFSSQQPKNPLGPFLNATIYRLMSWFYSGSGKKSLSDLDNLVHEVILQDDFKKEDLEGFRASTEAIRMDNWVDEDPHFSAKDGWIESSVQISVPADRVRHDSEDAAPKFEVPGLFYRKPLEVIKAAFQEQAAKYFHIHGFKQFWQATPDSQPERLYSEMYTSDAFLEEEAKIRAQPQTIGCQLETVVASIMLWSDSTHLTNFGTALLWPAYMYIGNQTKYTRAKPSAFAAHHFAYFPKVSIYLST